MDSLGRIKLTNINTERSVNLEPTGTVRLMECLYINPIFFYNKNRVCYKAMDDMYGVGVIMWELWTREPVCDLDLVRTIPNDKTEITVTGFLDSLEKLQPKQCPHFEVSVDKLYKQFVQDWWDTIHKCLNRAVSSKEVENSLNKIVTYPSVTQVDSGSGAYDRTCEDPSSVSFERETN